MLVGRQPLVLGDRLPGDREMSNFKHGMTGSRVHNTWMRMHDRCRNDRSGNYGQRGIRVCARWQSFVAFYEDMGDPPSDAHSIDRIDVNGNYEPGNCRWATRKEQARNTRANTLLRHRGEERTLAEWSELTGIKSTTICRRLASGWEIGRALTEPTAERLSVIKPWTVLGMSRSAWYRAGSPAP